MIHHEDQDQICSNNNSIVGDGGGSCVRSSSSSSSKKLKQRKVPQRGLGVAQLEKIRIEEQQKKDAKFSPPPLDSPTQNATTTDNKSKSSVVSYSHPSPPPPPPPRPPLIPPEFPSSSPLYRTHSMPNIENFHMDSLPPLNLPKGGGFSIGWPSIPNHCKNANVPKFWHHHELHSNHKGENSTILRDLSLPFETSSIAPLPEILPKAQHYQHQQSSTSLVRNASSSMNLSSSSSSSSLLNFPMEPPSNQSYLSNYAPSWSDDQKVMFGMKRPCPFQLEDPPIPIFGSKFAPINTNNALIQPKEATLSRNRGTKHNLEPPLLLKDSAPRSSVTHEPTTSSRKSIRLENGTSNEELLTLAPAGNTSTKKDGSNLKALPYHQAGFDCSLIDSRHNGSIKPPEYIRFFPTKLQTTSGSPSKTTHYSCNCEIGETIDLNLRL